MLPEDCRDVTRNTTFVALRHAARLHFDVCAQQIRAKVEKPGNDPLQDRGNDGVYS
jgi:hypothetical protein